MLYLNRLSTFFLFLMLLPTLLHPAATIAVKRLSSLKAVSAHLPVYMRSFSAGPAVQKFDLWQRSHELVHSSHGKPLLHPTTQPLYQAHLYNLHENPALFNQAYNEHTERTLPAFAAINSLIKENRSWHIIRRVGLEHWRLCILRMKLDDCYDKETLQQLAKKAMLTEKDYAELPPYLRDELRFARIAYKTVPEQLQYLIKAAQLNQISSKIKEEDYNTLFEKKLRTVCPEEVKAVHEKGITSACSVLNAAIVSAYHTPMSSEK